MSKIKEARLRLGMSQDDLALAADVSVPVISRMENSKQVSRTTFIRVCKILHIDPASVADVKVTDRKNVNLERQLKSIV